MNNLVKFDKRRKYYMILDCETATLPYASNFDASAKKKIAIAKPLIYDFAWKVVDRYGNEYSKHSYLISEIFSVPSVFDTAYYAHKRPLYIEKLQNGEIELVNWDTAISKFLHDLEVVESVGAYNSMFDYKKAIPFTELYIRMLYSNNYHKWLELQHKFIEKIVTESPNKPNRDFDEMNFEFRGKKYPMFDLWGLSCQHLLNNDTFREMCDCYGWHTASGKYYSTTAETAYRFLHNNMEFEESHTALEDVNIETEIFAEIVKRSKNKYEMGIIFFPFRIVGKVEM